VREQLSNVIGTSKQLEAARGWMFNPTVGVCQSGRTEQLPDFDGSGSKENNPGMLGTNLSRLESIIPPKSCSREFLSALALG
jgi:hypothetical protein